MRLTMQMIPRADQGAAGKNAGADYAPSADMVGKMTRYNDELASEGAPVSLDGLRTPATGAPVSFAGRKACVTDGPFTESKELLG